LRRVIETFISPDDDAIEKLGELFTDDVTVWTPNMLAVGVVDLAENLIYRESAFSDVDNPLRHPRHLREPWLGRVPSHRHLLRPLRH